MRHIRSSQCVNEPIQKAMENYEIPWRLTNLRTRSSVVFLASPNRTLAQIQAMRSKNAQGWKSAVSLEPLPADKTPENHGNS